ncbi:cyclic AMP-dependent transcription factor ATF-4-like [Acanthochromis polyacanthus]|uniref:Cyclic AMP-dependent transcription factor ATF-4 n=1 Tax=Acanthochromis polyacanthus TaxID=80966 RepID=A0A3Q1EN36_9TELE|nr:cyclic AMP-dependent transcription factor ATF-4-like [Acanthochromis polyacanthus]
MTTMKTNSQFGLEDMEALLWVPSSPMADAMSSQFFHLDTKQQQEGRGTLLEGDTSPASPHPLSPLSSSTSPAPFYSPPSSPPAILLSGDKARTESNLFSLPWLDHPVQLRGSQMLSSDGKENALSDLDWMAERMDLSEFDLDSLISSCSPAEESPSSPEDLLASLDCLPLPTFSPPLFSSLPIIPAVCSDPSVSIVDHSESCIDRQEVPDLAPCVQEPQEDLEIKSEPASPGSSSPVVDSPSFPAFTLDLGSEVDIAESEAKPVMASVVPQVPRFVLSLSPTRIVLVLTPKNEAKMPTSSEVIHCSSPASPPQRSSRSRPYPVPKYKSNPPPLSATSVEVKSCLGASGPERIVVKVPRQDKKQKKMEQNKTAAIRYRQKKRAEQDALIAEHALLKRRNIELTEKAGSMAREIEYLKELMEEVRSAILKKGIGTDP